MMSDLFESFANMTRAYAAGLKQRELPYLEDMRETLAMLEHRLDICNQYHETRAETLRRRIEIINQKIAEKENG